MFLHVKKKIYSFIWEDFMEQYMIRQNFKTTRMLFANIWKRILWCVKMVASCLVYVQNWERFFGIQLVRYDLLHNYMVRFWYGDEKDGIRRKAWRSLIGISVDRWKFNQNSRTGFFEVEGANVGKEVPLQQSYLPFKWTWLTYCG
jgi:hypothetical protein